MHTIAVKPLSANRMWRGRRYKTKLYQQYEELVLWVLPVITIPESPYCLTLIIGFSSANADLDNVAKPFIDIMQKKYGFNDRDIRELHLYKDKVKKGNEYITFSITTCHGLI